MPVVLSEVIGAVGLITLNRPQRLNGWTGPMATQLYDALDAFGADASVRVIVVTGSGRAFCAGADMGGLKSVSTGGKGAKKMVGGPESRDPLHPKRIPKPVICAINGPVAGIGLSFAMNCDMRFTNKAAKFTTSFSKRGLVAEYGSSWSLPNLVGTGNAMYMLMSSDVILGDEAHRMGIVQKVFDGDVLPRTIEFAQKMADTVSPTSLAAMKQQLWTHPLMEHEEATRQSILLMKSSLTAQNADFAEGVSSFLQKRPPAFAPLDPSNPVLMTAAQLQPGALKSKL